MHTPFAAGMTQLLMHASCAVDSILDKVIAGKPFQTQQMYKVLNSFSLMYYYP